MKAKEYRAQQPRHLHRGICSIPGDQLSQDRSASAMLRGRRGRAAAPRRLSPLTLSFHQRHDSLKLLGDRLPKVPFYKDLAASHLMAPCISFGQVFSALPDIMRTSPNVHSGSHLYHCRQYNVQLSDNRLLLISNHQSFPRKGGFISIFLARGTAVGHRAVRLLVLPRTACLAHRASNAALCRASLKVFRGF